MGKFTHRSTQKELMDDLHCGGSELKETLRELKTVNRWLGGNHVTTSGLEKFMKEKPQISYTLVDVGCGGGDMIHIMARWARRQNPVFEFLGVDANPNIIDLAKQRNPGENISYKVQNIFDREFEEEKVDIVTCTLFTHHFTQDELITFLKAVKNKARLGLLINDLHRHPLAYYSIKWIVKAFSKSGMVKNDAPLSVLRAFKKKELQEILREAGVSQFQITWHWAFRWQVFVLF
ncbi:methyltransferase domain-containing protein [Algoriphagus namhaensis]